MANNFKTYTKRDVTAHTAVMTSPAGATSTIIGLTVSNVSGVNTDVTVKLGATHIVKNATVIAGSAIVPIGSEQKIVVTAGQSIYVQATNAVDVVCSVLEQN